MAGTAMAITVDGNMGDWGIPAWTGFSTADNVDSPVTGYYNGVYYWEEDGNDDSYVGPGYGWQAYDIEALYVTIDSGNLYIGVITGFWPYDNFYNMGDIGIDVDGDSIYEYGIDTTNGIFHSGLTGDNWSAPTVPAHHQSGPASIIGGGIGSPPSDPINTGTFYYGTGFMNGPSSLYVIEAEVPLTDINWDGSGSFHITQTCGNDVADLSVPEPSTMLLFGTGLLGLAAVGRKKFRKK